MDKVKEEKAIERLRAFEPRNGEPYYLAYSGGKDSDAILILAELAAVEYEAVHNLTTADAPETVYYVRSKENVRINRPEITMWELIPKRLLPPTRWMRYCCSELKERGGKGRVVVTGVRWAESRARKESADVVKVIGRKSVETAEALDADYRKTRQGGIVLNNDNDAARKLVEHCHIQSKVMVNPIVDWTDDDVWEFLRHYGCKSNPLYECGFKRIGCVGCPLSSPKQRNIEFIKYPKYKQNYISAFDRMLVERKKRGKVSDWQNGEEVFRFWMGEDYKQLRFSDLGAME